ncbi:MAG: hypothetical protein COA40_12275 [Aequorivita sp.]|nr:MAG: hypothetical protein COA40_12275 [Aequorivita sp.]
MKTLKTILFSRFNVLFPLFVLVVLSIFLLTIRLKITHSFFYLFLAWNLFLAMIPFLISSYLISAKLLKKPVLYLVLTVWLLFLPNAPYLLTDFIHLRLSPLEWIGYDSLMLTVFSVTGLCFYIVSVKEMKQFLFAFFNQKTVLVFLAVLPFLVSFGMYLGRVLRWNSWDILHNPVSLFVDVFEIITDPVANYSAWTFTLSLGLVIKFASWFFENFIFDYLQD